MSPEQGERECGHRFPAPMYIPGGVALRTAVRGPNPLRFQDAHPGPPERGSQTNHSKCGPGSTEHCALTSLAEGAEEIAKSRQTSIDALANRFRKELEWIPLMAMRKERERRYASPLELARDVDNYLNGNRLLAGPESMTYHVRKFAGRNKTVLASIAAVLVGGAVFWSLGSRGLWCIVRPRHTRTRIGRVARGIIQSVAAPAAGAGTECSRSALARVDQESKSIPLGEQRRRRSGRSQ